MFKISFIAYIILQKTIISVVKFDFNTNKTIIPNLDFIDTIIKNEIYIEIKVGNPKLTIPTYLSLEQFSYYITGKNLSGIYNEYLSSSYQLKRNSKEINLNKFTVHEEKNRYNEFSQVEFVFKKI